MPLSSQISHLRLSQRGGWAFLAQPKLKSPTLRPGWVYLYPHPDGEWEALYFAHWIPGAERYSSFWELMQAEREA
jgi:hypothetical protein